MDLERFKSDIIPLRSHLLSVASRIVPNADDAEDAVQEALLRLWCRREQLGEVDNTKGYAVQLTKNICIDKLRSDRRQEPIEASVVFVQSETPYHEMERKDQAALIRTLIDRLPPLQQLIIRMRDIEAYELTEIAEITGTKVTSVTMNLSRARKKVRDEYLKIMSYER